MADLSSKDSGGTTGAKRPQFFRVRWWHWLVLLLLVVAFLVGYPPTFRWFVRELLAWDANLSGAKFEVGAVDGSVVTPVVLRDVRFEGPNSLGVAFGIEVEELAVRPNWWRILRRSSEGWFSAAEIRGAEAVIDLQGGRGPRREPRNPLIMNRIFPASLKVSDMRLLVKAEGRKLSLRGVRFETGELEQGSIEIGTARLDAVTFSREFQGLTGRTYLKGGRLEVAALRVTDEIEVSGAAALLRELFAGVLQIEFQMRAFGGSVRGQVRNVEGKHGPEAEVGGVFNGLSVKRFAAFIGRGISADGTIGEGKFTFRGRMEDLDDAMLTIRLNAGKFRWGDREWDSLVLGATLADRRIQIPELELRQRENSLNLSGDIGIPSANRPWWEQDFTFDVEAAIGNLNELARLGGDDFSDLVGRMEVSGSVRNRSGALGGQIIAKGSGIGWRGVPFDSFDVALKLSGHEVQVLNLSLVRGGDSLRSRGLLGIRGDMSYWGELQAFVSELGEYRALLNGIFEQTPTGHLKLEWSGDGSQKYHSGAFKVSVADFSLGLSRWHLNPMKGDFEGTYSPGHLALTRCAADFKKVRFSAGVVLGPGKTEVRDFKGEDFEKGILTGSATLPVDLFAAPALWVFHREGAVSGRIDARRFRIETLREVIPSLPKWNGEITGAVEVAGTSAKPMITGAISARDFGLEEERGRDAQFDFAGTSVAVTGWPFHFAPWPGLQAGGTIAGRIDWSGENIGVSGAGSVESLRVDGKIPVEVLLGEALWPQPELRISGGFESFGSLTVELRTVKAVSAAKGKITFESELKLERQDNGLIPVGGVSVTGTEVQVPTGEMTVTSGSVYWPEGDSRQPVLNIRASGKMGGRTLEVYRAGAAVGGAAALMSDPPEEEGALRRLLLEGRAQPDTPEASVMLRNGR